MKLANVPRRRKYGKVLCIYIINFLNIFFKTCLGGVVLETVLLRSPEVPTLVLSHFDVPGPGGGSGGGVDVQ